VARPGSVADAGVRQRCSAIEAAEEADQEERRWEAVGGGGARG